MILNKKDVPEWVGPDTVKGDTVDEEPVGDGVFGGRRRSASLEERVLTKRGSAPATRAAAAGANVLATRALAAFSLARLARDLRRFSFFWEAFQVRWPVQLQLHKGHWRRPPQMRNAVSPAPAHSQTPARCGQKHATRPDGICITAQDKSCMQDGQSLQDLISLQRHLHRSPSSLSRASRTVNLCSHVGHLRPTPCSSSATFSSSSR